MLTNKQKRQLKSMSNTLEAKYQIGKADLTNSIIDMLDKALIAHELIKVDVLKSCESPLMEIALDLSSKLNAEIVQVIGHKVVLFRQNKENSRIKLVK